MENLEIGNVANAPPRFSVVIAADSPTTVLIENQSFSIQAALDSAETREFFLDPGLLMYIEGSDLKGPFGIRVRAGRPVQVWARHYRLYFSESTLVLPTSQLKDDYLALAYIDDAASSNAIESSIAVLAPEEGTTVEVTPAVLVKGTPGRAAGIPFTVDLKRGEVYQIQSSGDLSGTRLRTLGGQKLAVFAGSRISLADFCNATSHLYDQQAPLDGWGKTFALLPLAGEGGDFVRVLASQDNTTFQVGCQTYIIEEAGAHFTFLCPSAALLRADKPVAVGLIPRGGACNSNPVTGADLRGDPSLLVLPPLEQVSRRVVYRRPLQFGFHYIPPEAYIELVFPASAEVRVNNAPLSAEVFPLPGNSALSYAILPVTADLTEVRCEAGLWAIAFTVDDLEVMTEHLGYQERADWPAGDLPVLPADIDFLPVDTVCPFQPLTFAVPKGVFFSQVQWDFGNGVQSTAVSAITQFNTPGAYSVQMTLWPEDCSTPRTYTRILQVPDCPVPPFAPLQILVDGDCTGLPVRVRFSPPNVVPYPPFEGVLSVSGVGAWSVPDYTFTINFGNVDSFALTLTAHYRDPWGRDTIYQIPIPQRNCFGDFSRDYLTAAGGCTGSPVRFEYNNGFSPYVANRVVSHRWDFGEPAATGDTSRSANPYHTYDAPGLYTVSVQVRKQNGDTATLFLPTLIRACDDLNIVKPPLQPGKCGNFLSPNPALDFVTLRAASVAPLIETPVQLFDAAGRLLFEGALNADGNTSEPLLLSDFPSGIYWLRYWCETGNRWEALKLVRMAP